MKKLLGLGGILIVIGFITGMIGWAVNGFSINNLNIDGPQLQSPQTKLVKNFNQINVAADANVIVRPGNHFQVKTRADKGTQLRAVVSNNTLNLTSNGKKHHLPWFLRINGSWSSTSMSDGSIIVYVPAHYNIKAINQAHNNHFLTLRNINVSDSLKLHGEVNLHQVTAKGINTNSENGDINVHNSRFNKFNSSLKSDNGDITVADSTFKKLSSLYSYNGDVTVKGIKVAAGNTSLTSFDGDISSKDSQFNTLNLSSDDGDVNFSNLKLNGNFHATSSDGDVSGRLLPKDRAHIIAASEDGDVNTNQITNYPNAKKVYRFHSDDGDITVH